jgi:hypothetical protein
MVSIELTEEIQSFAPDESISDVAPAPGDSLTSFIRPLVGGIQIGRRTSETTYSRCTMGFIANLDGVRVFITNSHCSDRSWDTDNTVFFQPYPFRYGEENRIGQEYRDRRGESCGFLSVNVCRNADATAASIDASIGSELGYIARTRYAAEGSYGVGSVEIDGANPRFRISGKGGPAYGGQPSNKMGIVTGWTSGRVQDTCVDVKQPGRTYSKLRCQYSVAMGTEPGDSGSPVFYNNGDGTVLLDGIVFGKTSGYSWYSPIFGVEQDLGTLDVGASTSSDGGSGGGCSTDPTAVQC